jgi:uncharacterized protein (TIGR03083 family)
MTTGSGKFSATETDAFRPNLGEADYIDALEAEGQLLLSIAETRRSEDHIPFCPGWTMSELITHLGFIYRWVSKVVGEIRSEPPGQQERVTIQDPDPSDYPATLSRLRTAHTGLVQLLRHTPPDLDCWTIWAAPSARTFWTRRMLHETLIHRVDAQNAGASSTLVGNKLPALLAADGVDEMICGFARRYTNTLRSEHCGTLVVAAIDTGHRWWVKIGPDAPQFGRGRPSWPVDTEVRAVSGELLLLLWNRRSAAGLAVEGRRYVLETWAREAHL